jgi:hypothetical protein
MFNYHRPHRRQSSFGRRGHLRYQPAVACARVSVTSKGVLAACLATGLIGALAPGALAAPPTRIPPGPIPDFTIADSCSFPVLVHVDTNNEVTTIFSDGRTLVTGSLKVTLTNTDDPTRSISVNVSGPGTFTPLPNGGTLQKAVGPWVFFFAPNQLGAGSPGMLILTTGVVTLQVDANGNPTFTHANGTTTDLCALLA